MTNVAQCLYRRILTSDLLNRCAVREAKCEKSGGHPEAELDRIHLLEALDWLTRAHDAVPYGGLSRGYSFGWNQYFPRKGWQPAHPRSTAEAIDVLFDCAALMNRIDLRQRATDLSDWLCKIQMYSGAIRGGALDEPPTSEIFNTALAILGWTRSARETNTERFCRAARQACNFLLNLQVGTSHQARYAGIASSSMMGLALIQAGIFLEEYTYCAAGEKCVAWALSQQQKNGWLRGISSDSPHHKLLQTILTTAEGMLQCGLILDKDKYTRAAKRIADVLLENYSPEESMEEYIRRNQSAGTQWSCLLGDAKMSSLWLQLYQITSEGSYLRSACRVIELLKKAQNRTSPNYGLRGGIKGSYPCDGDFGHYQTLSSVTVQFIKSLLLLSQLSPESDPVFLRAISAPV